MSSKKKSKKPAPKKRPVKAKVILTEEIRNPLEQELKSIKKLMLADKRVQQAVLERSMQLFDRVMEAVTFQLVAANRVGHLITEVSFHHALNDTLAEKMKEKK